MQQLCSRSVATATRREDRSFRVPGIEKGLERTTEEGLKSPFRFGGRVPTERQQIIGFFDDRSKAFQRFGNATAKFGLLFHGFSLIFRPALPLVYLPESAPIFSIPASQAFGS
jgi:hypothetical protein